MYIYKSVYLFACVYKSISLYAEKGSSIIYTVSRGPLQTSYQINGTQESGLA